MAVCEMCGEIVSKTTTIKVAGTNMQACSGCKDLGKPVEVESADFKHTFRKKAKVGMSLDINPNYVSILGKGMAKKGMNVHQLAKALNVKESSLTQYLSGKIKPDVDMARRLERFLEVKIVDEYEAGSKVDEDVFEVGSSESPSLGDMLLKQLNEKRNK